MKLKRIIALTGVFILLAMYLLTLYFAVIKSDFSQNLFIASLCSTIAIPLMIHLFLILTNIRNGKKLFDNPYSYRDKPDDEKKKS